MEGLLRRGLLGRPWGLPCSFHCTGTALYDVLITGAETFDVFERACKWGSVSISPRFFRELFSLLEHGGRFAAARAGNLLLSQTKKNPGKEGRMQLGSLHLPGFLIAGSSLGRPAARISAWAKSGLGSPAGSPAPAWCPLCSLWTDIF